MANLKEIRTRIASVNSTKKITSAMKMVSAAKFKKAQNCLFKFRPFHEKIQSLTACFLSSGKVKKGGIVGNRKQIRTIAIVLITSNNSLCGAFNVNIARCALSHYQKLKRMFPGSTVQFFCIGKKGEEVISRNGLPIITTEHLLVDKPTHKLAKRVYLSFQKGYLKGRFDRVDLVYNRFRNAATQDQIVEQLLPVPKPEKKESVLVKPIIEPDSSYFLSRILPYYALNSFYSAILESVAAEHGARMTAMHQATENAGALYDELVLDYNKARQSAITTEILEIVSGANALNQ